MSATEEQREAALRALGEDENRVMRALEILRKCESNTQRAQQKAYEGALAVLSETTQEMWQRVIVKSSLEFGLPSSGEVRYYASSSSLEEFIKAEVLPRCRDRRLELENRQLVREQSFGEAVNIPELEGFARYEIHLDRKFERTLAMLVKLQAFRRPKPIDIE